jgi:hypothetical protein
MSLPEGTVHRTGSERWLCHGGISAIFLGTRSLRISLPMFITSATREGEVLRAAPASLYRARLSHRVRGDMAQCSGKT